MVVIRQSIASPLIMASQPAVYIGLIFFVTIHTEPHFESLCRNPVHGLNLSMALLTLNVLFDVPYVSEKNMFRYIEDFFPRRRCIRIKILMFLFYPWEIGNDVIMTVEAFFNRRYSRKYRPTDIGVAKLTLNRLDTRVNTMTERDGLFGSDSGCR
jgi:hypothetical protein